MGTMSSRKSMPVVYLRSYAVRWPRGRRRGLLNGNPSLGTSSVFRLNPHSLSLLRFERVGWCGSGGPVLELAGTISGQSLAFSRVQLCQILTISVMESSLDVRADSL